ncbi:hypothetical protein DFH09DRAFT_1298221 [Mycena vulgaris]|nr:hypothetical protein DFH09DRAFT_1298221 [Mycena vulgaris]
MTSVVLAFLAVLGELGQDRLYRGYLELIKFVPGLKSAIVNCHVNELAAILGQLRKGAAGAMCDDNGSVRSAMVGWIGKNAKPPLDASSRVHRGLEGDVTGPLLFPVDYDHNDPEQVSPSVTDPVRAKVNNGDKDFMVTADQWPRGVYLNGVYDPANRGKRSFQVAVALADFHAYIHVTQAADKLQAEGDEENVQPSESTGDLHHRFNLSDAPQWNEVDGDFDYALYYNNIVDGLKLPLGPLRRRLSMNCSRGGISVSSRTVAVPPGASGSRAKFSVLTMRERRAARELNT